MPLPLPFMVAIGFLINLIVAILIANIIGSNNEIVKTSIGLYSLFICCTGMSAFLTERQYTVCIGMSLAVLLLVFLSSSKLLLQDTTALVEASSIVPVGLLGAYYGRYLSGKKQISKLMIKLRQL